MNAIRFRGSVVVGVLGFFTLTSPAYAQLYGWSVTAGNFTGTNDTVHRDTVIAGAPDDDEDATDAGSISVFTYSAGSSNVFYDNYLLQQYLNNSYFTGASDGGSESYDSFGYTYAVGDFDHDGYKDLAVGVPFESLGTTSDAGCVHILFGGPTSTGPLGMPFRKATAYLTRANIYPEIVSTTPASFDNFGISLAAGDFNGDGNDDLAIGAPDVTVNGVQDAGAVFVFYSQPGATGQAVFPTNNEYTLVQGGPYSQAGTPVFNARYGSSLAAGNFNGDFGSGSGTGPNGRQDVKDLAVGTPGQTVGSLSQAGAVTINYGGLNNIFNSSTNLVVTDPSPTANTAFGTSLAAADFNGYCSTGNAKTCTGLYDDLAVGEPFKSNGSGEVVVFYGASTGLTTSGSQVWTSANFGGLVPVQSNAEFGYSLATGNVINSTADNGGCQGQQCNPNELVIGEPYRTLNYTNQGAIYVLQGGIQKKLFIPTAGGVPIIPAGAHAYAGLSLAVGSIAKAANEDPSLIFQDILIGEPGANNVLLQMGGQAIVSSNRLNFPWAWADGS